MRARNITTWVMVTVLTMNVSVGAIFATPLVAEKIAVLFCGIT